MPCQSSILDYASLEDKSYLLLHILDYHCSTRLLNITRPGLPQRVFYVCMYTGCLPNQ